MPSQVRLSLSGNNLIINGETITNWLANIKTFTFNGKTILNLQIVTSGDNNTNNTKERLDILRFADGSRFKSVVENGTVKLENELVANFKTVLAKAIEFNISTPQSSDHYKGNNVTKILYGTGGVV